MQVHSVELQNPPTDDFEGTFVAAQGHADALLVLASPRFYRARTQLPALALKHRLPSMFPYREYVEAGGLMAYGTNLADMFRRAADYVDKILKGTKSANLPVEQPTKFEFVINLKTAQALGVTLPLPLRVLADQVIQ